MNILIVNILLDNIKVIHIKRSDKIDKIKLELIATFKIVDIGLINFCLGLKIKEKFVKRY